jgi:hypothetical protein
MLSEEKRRNLDRIDNQEALDRKKSKEKKKDWISNYLEDVEVTDLENMCKRANKPQISKDTTQEIGHLQGNLP